MFNTNKSLRDNRGMTLIEVMMAVAVFGIILLFITQMTTAGSRLTAGNSDQVRMMELARAEAERIKADPNHELPDDTNKIINYPPGTSGGDVEKKYAIMYDISEDMLKITVGPVNHGDTDNPLDINNLENFTLVMWMP